MDNEPERRYRTLTLDDIFLALGYDAPLTTERKCAVADVVIDSRRVTPGSVFVALPGERTDGHLYVRDAFERGAVAAIVQQAPDNQPPPLFSSGLRERKAAHLDGQNRGGDFPTAGAKPPPLYIRVPNSLAALHRLAGWWRAQFDVRIIGVTGSIGKTTTKEYVASVLAQRYNVLKSQGSYNNEIGLPLTLLKLNDSHERAVVEMGTFGPGEITQLTDMARPQVGIVTNVSAVHLERMGTIANIARAKAELPRALPADGVVILNGDDERVRQMARQTQARPFFYGLTPRCDLWADLVSSQGLDGIRFRFHHRSESIDVQLPLLGKHSVYTALSAASVGLVEGLSWDEIVRGLQTGAPIRLVVAPGIKGATLLDDTYNSSPDSAVAALNLIDELDGAKIAVLGDMLELGDGESKGHRRVGRRARQVVETLVTVGRLGRLIGQGALDAGMRPEQVIQLDDNAAAIAYLKTILDQDAVVLIKGSRGMRMEQIVDALSEKHSFDIAARTKPGGNRRKQDG